MILMRRMTIFIRKDIFFRMQKFYRIIIGSSNFTKAALGSNREWNIRIISTDKGEMAQEILEEFQELWNSQYTMEFDDFYEEYAERYRIIKQQQKNSTSGTDSIY